MKHDDGGFFEVRYERIDRPTGYSTRIHIGTFWIILAALLVYAVCR